MKKFLAILISSLFSFSVFANGGPTGLGIIVGDPTGISFKYDMKQNAIDAALAWTNHVDIHLHADYLWQVANPFKMNKPIDGFFGIGGRIQDHDDDKCYRRNSRYYCDDHEDETFFGVRFPAGLRYMFRDPSIEVFGELAAIMDLVPETDMDLDIGIGARYFF